MRTVEEHDEVLRVERKAGAEVTGLLRLIGSRWMAIALMTAIVLMTTAVALLFVPKTYESSASLVIEARDSADLRPSGETLFDADMSAEALVSSHLELVGSRDLLLEVATTLNLAAVPEFVSTSEPLSGLVMQLVGRRPVPVSVEERALANLSERLTITRNRDSTVISIAVRSVDPDLAADIANGIARAHVQRREAKSRDDAAEATGWLQQQIAIFQGKVAAAETAVANYRLENDLFVGGSAIPATDQQLSAVAGQIAEAQQRKNDAQERAEVIRGLVAAGRSLEGVAEIRDSLVIQRLLESSAKLKAELAQRSTTLLDGHPTMKALRAQLAELQVQIVAEARRVADSLDAEAQVEAGLEQRLRDDLARAKLGAGDAAREGVNLEALEREARAQRAQLEGYLGRYASLSSGTAAGSALADARLVTAAVPASEPVSPNVPLILGAAAAAALAVQIGAILIGTIVSGRAHGGAGLPGDESSDVEADSEVFDTREGSETGASLAVPHDAPDPGAPFHTPSRPADELSELSAAVAAGEVRVVLLAALESRDNCILAGDRLLDHALAARLSAIVVDAGSGELSRFPGLTDLSAGRADYGDVVQRIDDSLAEVPWGRLAAIDDRSPRPATLVEALADIYHLVLVDTGTIGKASGLPAFAGSAAHLVLVAGSTPRPSTIAAVEHDLAGLGLAIDRVVTVPRLQSNVA